MNTTELRPQFQRLRIQIKGQTAVDARRGLEARRLIHQARDNEGFSEIALVLEASLNTFEQAIVENADKATVEAARRACLAALDSMIRRLSA